jgi:hypothetical protein
VLLFVEFLVQLLESLNVAIGRIARSVSVGTV